MPIDKNYKEPKHSDVIKKLPDDKTFIIGQDYKNEVATTICCKKCGSKSFNVGKASHYTAIRCVECEWQLCIHEG